MGVKEFKEFVDEHVLLKDEVINGNKTWQSLYEDYVLLGENHDSWKKYIKADRSNIKDVIDMVKNINVDNLNKTLNNVSKIVSIIQGFNLKGGGNKLNTGDPLFDKSFDDWY